MVQVWDPQATRGASAKFLVRFHYPLLVAIVLLAGLVAFGPAPAGLPTAGQRTLGIFTLCAMLWVTGLIPLQITSILAIILLPLTGVMSADEAFALFGNQSVFFILGAFILSAVLVECGLSTRLACIALEKGSAGPRRLRTVILLTAAFASFWMSEHAVAAMLFPMVYSIVRAFGLQPGKSRFAMSFFLALAWGCIIGGIATYLGGARNPLAAGILFSETGREISFLRLLSASFPIVVPLLVAAQLLLRSRYPEEPVDMEAARGILRDERSRIGPLSRREVAIGVLSVGTILAWITLHQAVGLAIIALVSVALMFVLRLTKWETIETNVNWAIILMYGGAIALGAALDSSGASEWAVTTVLGDTRLSALQLLLVLGGLSLVLTEFISNAAVVSVLMPVGLGLARAHDISPEAVTLAIALPSGLSYVLPMGTPATAIAYSSGYIPQGEFFKTGALMNGISLIFFYLVVWLYWPLIGMR